MLTELTLEGVKSFADRTEVPFAPLTVLTGVNSSGKSTVFQGLLLLKQAFRLPLLSSAGMQLNGPFVAIGSYDDWSSKHNRGPFSLVVTIDGNPLLAALVRSNRRYRDLLGTRNRWQYYQRDFGQTTSISAGGRLELQFTEAPKLPSVALLETMRWQSRVYEGTAQDSHYTLTVKRLPVDASEASRGPALPSDVDLEQFPFVLTDEYAGTAWRERSTARENAVPLRCSVDGLTPTFVVESTPRPQWPITLGAAVAKAVGVAGAELEVLANRAIGRKSRFRTKGRSISPANPPSVLRAHLRFLNGCSDTELIDFLQSTSAAFLGSYVVQLDASSGVDATRQRLLHAIGRELFQRTARLVAELSDRDQSKDELSAAGSVRAEFAVDVAPTVAEAIELVTVVASKTGDPEVSADMLALLARSAQEMKETQRQLVRRPAGRRRINSAPRAESPVDLVPSWEDLAQRHFKDLLLHLGPLREEPRNLYAAEPPVSADDVGKKGERAISCLRMYGEHTMVLAPDPTASPGVVREMSLLDAVVAWGRRLGVFDSLSIDASRTKYGTVVNIIGQMDGSEIHPDLTNVGVGVSQLLPVLVICLAAQPGSTVLVEQPELHLHPSVQTRLGEFLAACALSGRQVIVETHSEHLINMLRLLVAKGTLDPTRDLSLLFSERDTFGTAMTRIAVQADGGLDRWPTGFFDEAENTLSAIMNTRLAKGR